MPMHDWTRVEAGIYHHFHHEWISALGRSLNRSLLPADYYAMAEQHAAGFGPDVLTLQDVGDGAAEPGGVGTLVRTRPKASHFAESATAFYRRKKSTVVVRHVSGDRVVAMIEVLSPGNKNSASAFQAFVNKVSELLEHGVHLLLIDPFPPGPRDPSGVHGAVWGMVDDAPFRTDPAKPLTLVAYEAGPTTRAYVETIAVGDALPDMPLFLEPGGHVPTPLGATYSAAWDTVPARWRRVIAPGE